MAKTTAHPKVAAYLARATLWREEMTLLRKIALSCPLIEEVKWGKPCYTFEGKNVVLIIGFKNYCSLLFCKGALLKDTEGILVKAGEQTQAARQARFTSLAEVSKRERVVKAYFMEAIAVEKAGLEVVYRKPNDIPFPAEFQQALAKSAALKKAFAALTPGRQRAYIIHFSSAKQSETRAARVEKCRQQILEGIGWNEEYKRSA